MANRFTDAELKNRVLAMLPKEIPAWAIADVEADPYNHSENSERPSYWVYLADGWKVCGDWCHTIHVDTLAELRAELRAIEIWPDDEALEKNNGYGRPEGWQPPEAQQTEESTQEAEKAALEAVLEEARGPSGLEYRSAEIMLAWGGPSIYLDTAAALVRLYWWGENAEFPVHREACDALDEILEELFAL